MRGTSLSLAVYVISLPADIKRRDRISHQFKATSQNFNYIDAVNGRELSAQTYFNYALPLFNRIGRLMTPGEVGCSLSHKKALETFLASHNEYALILEDDVIGNDTALYEVERSLSAMSNDSILIAGGQEGVKSKYLLGTACDNGVSLVSQFSHNYITRACCYVVTRQSARQILKHHETILTIADDWAYILNNTGIRIFFKEILQHPIDLSDSNLETDRVSLPKLSKKNNSIIKELHRLIRKVKILLLRLKGNKSL